MVILYRQKEERDHSKSDRKSDEYKENTDRHKRSQVSLSEWVVTKFCEIGAFTKFLSLFCVLFFLRSVFNVMKDIVHRGLCV